MSVIVIQHVGCEPMGLLEDLMEEYRVEYHYVHPYRGEPIPGGTAGMGALVLMGGPMNVYDYTAHPFLLEEDRLIRAALEEDLPILGICFGAQLLAKAADAPVRKGPVKEVGWYPLHLTEDAETDPLFSRMGPGFPVFQWHGDTFDLPDGATPLAHTRDYPHQAFRLGRWAYGLQFHLEVTRPLIRAWVETYPEDLTEKDLFPLDREELLLPLHQRAREVFTRYFRLCHLIP